MINSFTNTLKSFIFNSKSSETTERVDRKRKRQNDESSDGDCDVGILSVKKKKIHNTGNTGFTGLFSSATVQSMSDWVQRKTPSLFNWTSSKNKSVSFQGNGHNGNGEGKQKCETHHRFSRVDVPNVYRWGALPKEERTTDSQQSLIRPSIHGSLQQSKQVQTDRETGAVKDRFSEMFRTRNKHRFTAGDSVRLEDKIRYQQLIQKFTTVPLEEERSKIKQNDRIKSPVRVPQLPRFYFSSNDSILSSTIQQQPPPERARAAGNQRIKVRPKQSTPRQITNGRPPQDDSIQITDISVIPSARTHTPQTETTCIDLTEEKEPDRLERTSSRDTPTLDYRDSKFLSENWIKDLTTTYSAKVRERDRQLKEAELRTKLLEERRRQDEADLERKMRQQMHIHRKEPVVIEDEPIEYHFEEEQAEEQEEEATLPELTSEMENVINNALSRGNPGEVLVEKFRLQITKNDIATLAGLNWLNDEVINFYMNLLMERGEKDGNSKVYAFNTFFYPKVMSGGQAAVKRWTRRVDVLAVDYILIPVHLGMHWCLAVINFKKKDIQYYDSMGGNNIQCLNALNCWAISLGDKEWIIYTPNLACLLINIFFLCSILRILLTQLQAHPNEPSNFRRALKATFVLIPLFGVQLAVTIYRKGLESQGAVHYERFSEVVSNTQGFVVALIFCFFNGEVASQVKRSWRRFHWEGLSSSRRLNATLSLHFNNSVTQRTEHVHSRRNSLEPCIDDAQTASTPQSRESQPL